VLDPNEVGPVVSRGLGEFANADIGLVGRAVLTLLFISSDTPLFWLTKSGVSPKIGDGRQ